MADRFDVLKKLLKGGSAAYKVPTERPGIKAQKKAFDTFQRAPLHYINSRWLVALRGWKG